MTEFLAAAGNQGPSRLRELLTTAVADRKPLVLPGCYDALGARLIEQAGFDGVYMTGYGTTASLLGRPDVGLLTATEMINNASRVVSATSLPVITDADTGYGNPINVIRTVADYQRAGVAGIHIEDQIMPKKCGHMENKQVVARSEMAAKVKAAVAARTDPDLVLIARTDARAPLGLDEAIARASACVDAGADVLFVEALQGPDEIAQVAAEFSGVPLLFNWVEGGKTPPLTYSEIAELGFAVIIMPVGMLFAATTALQGYLSQLKQDGTPAAFADQMMSFDEFGETIGLDEINELERRFSADG